MRVQHAHFPTLNISAYLFHGLDFPAISTAKDIALFMLLGEASFFPAMPKAVP